MTIYSAVLVVHSWLRWVLLLLGLLLVARTAAGWLRSRTWASADERLQVAFLGVMDLQFLTGLVLYGVLSPTIRLFFSDPAAGMGQPGVRFFAVEHAFVMFVAVAAAHVGRAVARRAATDAQRHTRACVATTIALLLVLAATPWPGLRHGRPLFRTANLDDGPRLATLAAAARLPSSESGAPQPVVRDQASAAR